MAAADDRRQPATYGAGGERPPWIEEATDPTYWDVAFGSYGDGYLEWVNSHYYWDADEARTLADTRTLWDRRGAYVDTDALIAHHVNHQTRPSKAA